MIFRLTTDQVLDLLDEWPKSELRFVGPVTDWCMDSLGYVPEVTSRKTVVIGVSYSYFITVPNDLDAVKFKLRWL